MEWSCAVFFQNVYIRPYCIAIASWKLQADISIMFLLHELIIYSPDIKRIAFACRPKKVWTAKPSSALGRYDGLMEVKEPATAFATTPLTLPQKSSKARQVHLHLKHSPDGLLDDGPLPSYHRQSGTIRPASTTTYHCTCSVTRAEQTNRHLELLLCMLLLLPGMRASFLPLHALCSDFRSGSNSHQSHGSLPGPNRLYNTVQTNPTCCLTPYVTCLMINKVLSSFADGSQSCQCR